MIAKQVWPVLRRHGFKRSSGTFRRLSDVGHAAVVQFQGSAGSWGATSLFYVNLGVATTQWLEWKQDRLGGHRRDRPTASLAQWWTRLRAPSRFANDFDCWAIRSVDDAPECGVAIGRELTELVLPTFDAWLEHYVRLDEALLRGRDEELPALIATRPLELMKGFDRFGWVDHQYVQWVRSKRTSTGPGT